MTTLGITVGCLDCGGPMVLARPGVHHPARVTTVLACADCAAELALRVEVARITPSPLEVNERARAYRARKKQAA